jgi:hypothetical protein
VKISFDIDGVIASFEDAAIKVVREMYLPDLPANTEMRRYNFDDLITKKQWDTVYAKMLATPYLWLHLDPFTESVEAIRHYVAGHGEEGIYYITARKNSAGHGGAKEMTQAWLSELMLPWKNVIVVDRTREKLTHIIDNGIHFSIDDLDRTVELCQGIPNHTALLLDRPYNQEADLPRVYSVEEFLLHVEASQ